MAEPFIAPEVFEDYWEIFFEGIEIIARPIMDSDNIMRLPFRVKINGLWIDDAVDVSYSSPRMFESGGATIKVKNPKQEDGTHKYADPDELLGSIDIYALVLDDYTKVSRSGVWAAEYKPRLWFRFDENVSVLKGIDEENAEPGYSIVDDPQADFWTAVITGTGGNCTLPGLKDMGTYAITGEVGLRIASDAGSATTFYLKHDFDSTLDWSDFNFFTMAWYGNGANTYQIQLMTSTTAYFHYDFADVTVGWKRVGFPLSAMSSSGSPNWSTITQIRIAADFGNSSWKINNYLDDLRLHEWIAYNWYDMKNTLEWKNVADHYFGVGYSTAVTTAWDQYLTNYCIDLPGSEAYGEIAHNNTLEFQDNLTIALWANPDTVNYSSGGERWLFCKGAVGVNGWGVRHDASGRVKIYTYDGATTNMGASTAGVLTAGNWLNLIIKKGGSTVKVLADGADKTYDGTCASGAASTYPIRIGCSNESTPADFFDGKLDNVMLWNATLPDTWCETLFAEGPEILAGTKGWRMVKVWSGNVQETDHDSEGLNIILSCDDNTALLATTITTRRETLVSKTDQELIKYIMKKYLPEVDSDEYVTQVKQKAIPLFLVESNVTLMSIFKSIASWAGALFWVDKDRKLHYLTDDAASSGTLTLNEFKDFKSLKLKRSLRDMFNDYTLETTISYPHYRDENTEYTVLDDIDGWKGGRWDSEATQNPDADAYVDKQNSTTNYGSSSDLIMHQDSGGVDHKHTYVRFPAPSGVIGLQKQSLNARLYVYSRTGGGQARVYDIALGDETWGESTINWDNKPSSVNLLMSKNHAAVGWWDFNGADLQTHVNNRWLDGDPVTLLFKENVNDEQINAYSKEYNGNDPQLKYTAVTSLTGAASAGIYKSDLSDKGGDPEHWKYCIRLDQGVGYAIYPTGQTFNLNPLVYTRFYAKHGILVNGLSTVEFRFHFNTANYYSFEEGISNTTNATVNWGQIMGYGDDSANYGRLFEDMALTGTVPTVNWVEIRRIQGTMQGDLLFDEFWFGGKVKINKVNQESIDRYGRRSKVEAREYIGTKEYADSYAYAKVAEASAVDQEIFIPSLRLELLGRISYGDTVTINAPTRGISNQQYIVVQISEQISANSKKVSVSLNKIIKDIYKYLQTVVVGGVRIDDDPLQACQTAAEAGCGETCLTPCETGCEVACEAVGEACLGGCRTCGQAGYCRAYCMLHCQEGCQAVCQDSCQLECQDICQKDCQGACQTGTCQSACKTGCQTNCKNDICQPGDCQTGACESQCQPCQVGCQVTCQLCWEGGPHCQSGCLVACQDCGEATGPCQTACETTACKEACEVVCQGFWEAIT